MVSTPTTTLLLIATVPRKCPPPRDLTLRSCRVAPPPPLKRPPRDCGLPQLAASYPRLDSAGRYLKLRLPDRRAGPPLRHLRQPFRVFPATSLQGRSGGSTLWLTSGRTSALRRRVYGRDVSPLPSSDCWSACERHKHSTL
ncbi:hypothetical protein MDA_GLEAN10016040 [Myotis davidii]|uniref:Uncharacterized protein n=1 Tax=Myotis davidii TaxID=225400 RepID=L5M9D0_MYODS|nr:hypothetical protein MDA_GLEAN10016040 [Myotis davidii]